MTTVETVRGPVDVETLGVALMHEHIAMLEPQMLANYGNVWGEAYWEEEAGVAHAITTLQRAHAGGIATIVDPTAADIGRDIPRLQRINDAVDLHIIVASGLYGYLHLTPFWNLRTPDQMTEVFVRELTVGINDTGVRAAFLKCSVEEHGIIAAVPRILASVAAASIETGAPIMVHTDAMHRRGIDAVEALSAHGVDPRRIVLAHSCNSNDLDYHRALADSGAWLGFDAFGIEVFNSDENRISALVALIGEGYIDQIHLSHDAATFYDFQPHNPWLADLEPDYLHITHRILPRLRDAGITDAQIHRLMVDNPRRFFSGPDGG